MFESHSRQLNYSKKKWAVLSAVELFALHLHCCSSMIHACMYSHQVYNSNGGLAPKIGLVLGQSGMVIPMNKPIKVYVSVKLHIPTY